MKGCKKVLSVLLCLSMIMGMILVPFDSQAATKLKLSKTKATMTVGSSLTLTAKWGKKKASGAKWKTSNKKVVTVSKGKLKAKKKGKAKITATYKGKKSVCNVTVVAKKNNNTNTNTNTSQNTSQNTNQNTNTNTNTNDNSQNTNKEPEDVYTLSKTQASVMVEKTLQLNLNSSDSSYSVYTGVSWSSSNTSVAEVNDYGLVKALFPGNTTITAKYNGVDYNCAVTVTAPDYKINKTSASMDTDWRRGDNTIGLTLRAGIDLAKDVEWKTSNAEVAAVDANGLVRAMGKGTATITGTKYGKAFTCAVTVEGFDVKKDLNIVHGQITKEVKLTIKKTGNAEKDKAEIDELKELGFTINESETEATKNQKCEKVTYTFNRLPQTLSEIKSLFDEPEKDDTVDLEKKNAGLNYGGFNAMAATICATLCDPWKPNAYNPNYEGHPVRDIFEFLNGPEYEASPASLNTAIGSMKDAVQLCGENVYKSYFKGATVANKYDVSAPYVLELYKGPYYISEKETITGTRPTTYMILVGAGGLSTGADGIKTGISGFDSERYIDVYYSQTDKRWYSYDDNFKHITANNFKKP